MSKANVTLNVKNWDEKPYLEFEDGRKLTRAAVVYTYEGDLRGEGNVDYLMVYDKNGSAHFVGLERVNALLGGKQGTFVAQHVGKFEGKVAKTEWTIVPGSGTDALAGITGSGNFSAEGEGAQSVSFKYEL